MIAISQSLIGSRCKAIMDVNIIWSITILLRMYVARPSGWEQHQHTGH